MAEEVAEWGPEVKAPEVESSEGKAEAALPEVLEEPKLPDPPEPKNRKMNRWIGRKSEQEAPVAADWRQKRKRIVAAVDPFCPSK